MHRSHRSLFSFVTLGVAFAIACGANPIDVPEDKGDDDDDNRGGTGTGASGGTGNTFSGGTASGGFPSGGAFPSGGTATGGFSGTPATGGVAGTPASGGVFTGGTPATGGSLPTGGTAGAGISGAAGSAGTPGGAGTGAGATCETAFVAGTDGFVRAPAAAGGCWHGYAYAGGDTGSMLTTMTSFSTCGMPCVLRVAGTLGPAVAPSYAGVVFLGFNVNQPLGSSTFTTLVPAGTSLQVTYTKVAGPAAIRVQIQAGTSRWCANLTTSPATIPYTSFNLMCWEPVPPATGAYAKQPIEAVQLVAPGEMTGVPIDMTLVSVKDM